MKISLKQIPHSMNKSRLLVKLVVLKRSLLNEDFEQSWTIASKRNGEVKKVIDIVDYTMQSPTHEKWNPSSHKHQQGLDQDHMLDRTPSHDSDGVSEISMQQSAFSSAFYPPTPSICSPDQVYSHKTKKLNLSSIDRAQLEERNAEEESVADAVAGSVIEFDQYSQMMAHSEEAHLLEEDSVELQSVSQSLSEKVLKSGDRSRYNKPIENTHAGTRVAEAVTGSVDLNNDQQAMMAMLLKLAQSPATSTLLSQLMLAQQLQSAALIGPALSMPATSTFVPPVAVPHSSVQRPLSVAPTHPTIPDACYYDTHPLSHAELTRRYLYAENEAFPSIRQPQFQDVGGYNEGKNNNFPVSINPDNCSRLTVIPSSALNRQLRDEFSDSASVTSSHNSAIPSNSAPGGRETCLLELSGPHIDNNVLVQMAELRLEEATQDKRKVIAIEVAEANITSLQASIGQVFAPCADSRHDNVATSHTALQTQLNALRATVLEDSLKHLAVNGCLQLTQLDPSVNRFRSLTTLNMSGNRLRSLSGPLDLPLLRSIDLSHNLLTSLDFLQLLTGLSSLNASNNRIVSLSLSINMLVAHSKCLAALDLSNNPVEHNLFFSV
ncbi:MAG: hypothetical protein B7Z23_02460 [Pseudomonadales bacterium 32-61-5]|nr:MAG: hypothetical protein B7Z23_02460 [Pseudomonadales bacterium 32-61-5]